MKGVFGVRTMGAALAAVTCLAAASSASAGQLWVGTRNPATGQITVRTDGLNPYFEDGTPVGSFAIREFSDNLLPSAFLLIRRTGGGAPGTCRTEATRLVVTADRLYLDLDAASHTVLYCANPNSDCTSCRVDRNLDGYYCACINNGSVLGECLGRVNDALKGDFDVDWALPIPEPGPSPHGN